MKRHLFWAGKRSETAFMRVWEGKEVRTFNCCVTEPGESDGFSDSGILRLASLIIMHIFI